MKLSGLKIGHQTLTELGTGVTVFLLDDLSPCSYWLCGSAPASRELALLEPSTMIAGINALVFAGGSAFGLAAAEGVMTWCREQGRGFPTAHGVVPIVPAGCIYDLDIKSPIAPTAQDGYAACEAAVASNIAQGLVGVGHGATVGKYFADAIPARGGFGYQQITTPDGLSVVAAVVVNSIGEIRDADNQIIAGARDATGQIQSIAAAIARGDVGFSDLHPVMKNTVLVAVFTNAELDKAALQRLAKSASSGVAKAIFPSFTAYDGDIIFCTSVGKIQAEPVLLGGLAEQAVRQAIYNAVK